jgi:F-type H+-transporting ATPase subunit b
VAASEPTSTGGHGQEVAAAATHAGDAAHGGGNAGLPQFDPTYFPSQLFWLALIFLGLYLVLSRVLLPRVGGMIEARDAKIRADVDSANAASTAAQAALTAYDTAIAKAKADARARTDAARAEAAARRTEQTMVAEQALNQKLDAVEQRLAGARATSMAAAREAAADAAKAIVQRIAGIDVSDSDAKTAVGSP